MQAPHEAYRDSTRAAVQLVLWTVAWTASLAVARFGPEQLWDSQEGVSWTAVLAHLAIGVGWVIAFTRFLGALDELQRKVIQDALAIALGAGWVGGFAYFAADHAELITTDVNIALLPGGMGIVFLLAFVIGNIRYR